MFQGTPGSRAGSEISADRPVRPGAAPEVAHGSRRSRVLLSPPHLAGDEDIYLRDVMASNWIAPLGPEVDAFEDEFAREVGVDHAVALSSGTAALHVALR